MCYELILLFIYLYNDLNYFDINIGNICPKHHFSSYDQMFHIVHSQSTSLFSEPKSLFKPFELSVNSDFILNTI